MIIGGGYIAVEFASIAAAVGGTSALEKVWWAGELADWFRFVLSADTLLLTN